jgi:hypothetical protein
VGSVVIYRMSEQVIKLRDHWCKEFIPEDVEFCWD